MNLFSANRLGRCLSTVFFLVMITIFTHTLLLASPITQMCRDQVKGFSNIAFDDERHRGWYYRFWSGDCGKVPFPEWFVCQSKKNTWNDIAQKTLSRATPENNKAVRVSICKLGEFIGLEWARDNNIRCIHTRDLAPLGDILDDPSVAVEQGIKNTWSKARGMMDRSPCPHN